VVCSKYPRLAVNKLRRKTCAIHWGKPGHARNVGHSSIHLALRIRSSGVYNYGSLKCRRRRQSFRAEPANRITPVYSGDEMHGGDALTTSGRFRRFFRNLPGSPTVSRTGSPLYATPVTLLTHYIIPITLFTRALLTSIRALFIFIFIVIIIFFFWLIFISVRVASILFRSLQPNDDVCHPNRDICMQW
jgi:hypothetical protein